MPAHLYTTLRVPRTEGALPRGAAADLPHPMIVIRRGKITPAAGRPCSRSCPNWSVGLKCRMRLGAGPAGPRRRLRCREDFDESRNGLVACPVQVGRDRRPASLDEICRCRAGPPQSLEKRAPKEARRWQAKKILLLVGDFRQDYGDHGGRSRPAGSGACRARRPAPARRLARRSAPPCTTSRAPRPTARSRGHDFALNATFDPGTVRRTTNTRFVIAGGRAPGVPAARQEGDRAGCGSSRSASRWRPSATEAQISPPPTWCAVAWCPATRHCAPEVRAAGRRVGGHSAIRSSRGRPRNFVTAPPWPASPAWLSEVSSQVLGKRIEPVRAHQPPQLRESPGSHSCSRSSARATGARDAAVA